MKTVDLKAIKTASEKVMLELSDSEVEELASDLNRLLEDFIDIKEADKLTPMVFPFEVTNEYLREDEVKSSYSKEEILKNAKEVKDDKIVLPRVVK